MDHGLSKEWLRHRVSELEEQESKREQENRAWTARRAQGRDQSRSSAVQRAQSVVSDIDRSIHGMAGPPIGRSASRGRWRSRDGMHAPSTHSASEKQDDRRSQKIFQDLAALEAAAIESRYGRQEVEETLHRLNQQSRWPQTNQQAQQPQNQQQYQHPQLPPKTPGFSGTSRAKVVPSFGDVGTRQSVQQPYYQEQQRQQQLQQERSDGDWEMVQSQTDIDRIKSKVLNVMGESVLGQSQSMDQSHTSASSRKFASGSGYVNGRRMGGQDGSHGYGGPGAGGPPLPSWGNELASRLSQVA